MEGIKLAFIIIIVLAVAWTAAKNPISRPGNSFGFYAPSSGGIYTPPSQLPTDTQGIGNELNKINLDANRIQQEIKQNQIAAESSSLYNDIYLYASNAWSTDPKTEYLTFNLNSQHKGKVLLTGFEIRSTATGRGTTIPKGVELPFAGEINAETPIFINPGDTVILSTGRSPVGYSFRENKCTGYFGQFQTFTPFLQQSCPRPESENIAQAPHYFNDACLNYLDSLQSCIMPLQNIPDIGSIQSQCYIYVTEDINYKTCVDNHKNDPDFYGKQWRIYLSQEQELWKSQREVIKLLDLDKKTVAAITY
jgi:hypothetical protein